MSTRTTITFEDDLLVEAKVKAARSGRTLSEVVNAAVREALRQDTKPGRYTFTTSGQPGGPGSAISLESNEAILDFLDDDTALHAAD